MEVSLEVDGRNSLPVPYQNHGENYKYYNGEEQSHQSSDAMHSLGPRSQSRRICGLLPVTLFLSIALAVVVVLAAIAIGVAGSLAAKRADARPVGQSHSNSSTQAFNASCPSSNDTSAPFQPTSNCTSLGSTYTSRFTGAKYKPQCGLDLYGHDIYSVFVYYFTDCIEACAGLSEYPALNHTCSGVTFDIDFEVTSAGQYGNCFLKSGGSTPTADNKSSSATLIEG